MSATDTADNSTNRFKSLIVCISSLVGYWLFYNLTVYNSPQGMEFFQTRYAVVPYEIGANERPNAAEFVAAEGLYAWESCSAPCYYVARFTLTPDQTGDWGFVPSYNTDNFKVFLNGVPVTQPGEFEQPTFHGKRSWLSRLPKELIKQGSENHIDLYLARWVDTGKVRGAFLGPYDQLERALASRFFFFYDLPYYSALAGLTLAALMLVAVPLSQARKTLLWFAAVTSSWALLALYRHWFTIPGDDVFRAAYYFSIANFVYLSFLVFFNHWSGTQSRWLDRTAIALFVFAHLLYHAIGDNLTVIEKEELITDPFQVFIVATLIGTAVRHYWQAAELRIVESAAVFAAISAAGLDTLAQITGVFDFYSVPRTLPVFILAVTASMFYRHLRLFESEQSRREFLEAELTEAKAELDARHAAEREAEHRQILSDERVRILQDMHDGVGGRLAALLEHQKGLPQSDAVLTRELQQSLQDLVLIIDSLDEDLNEDLGSALGTLRSRLTPYLSDAGYELKWRVNLPHALRISPERSLHLYRCLQEAINNAVRHARASEISLTADLDGEEVKIVVTDDGVGIPDDANGRGLKNMRTRAAMLNGSLTVSNHTPKGTLISINFAAETQS